MCDSCCHPKGFLLGVKFTTKLVAGWKMMELAPKYPWTEQPTDLLSLLHGREMPLLISH